MMTWDQQRSRNLKMRDKKGVALKDAEDPIVKGGVLKGLEDGLIKQSLTEPEHEKEKSKDSKSIKTVKVSHHDENSIFIPHL